MHRELLASPTTFMALFISNTVVAKAAEPVIGLMIFASPVSTITAGTARLTVIVSPVAGRVGRGGDDPHGRCHDGRHLRRAGRQETRMKTAIPLYIAAHEAGHAVAIHYLGWRYFCVAVRSPDQGMYVDRRGRSRSLSGIVEGGFTDPPSLWGGSIGDWSADRVTIARDGVVRAEAILALSGPIAESRVRHCSLIAVLLGGGADDHEHFSRLLNDFWPCKAERQAVEQTIEQQAFAIMRRADVWRATLALAKVLQVRGTLGFEDAEPIVQAAGLAPQEFLAALSLDTEGARVTRVAGSLGASDLIAEGSTDVLRVLLDTSDRPGGG
jgi:hypothetical protein